MTTIYLTLISKAVAGRIDPTPPPAGHGYKVASCKDCPNRPIFILEDVTFVQHFDLFIAAFPDDTGTAAVDAQSWLNTNKAVFKGMTSYVTEEP